MPNGNAIITICTDTKYLPGVCCFVERAKQFCTTPVFVLVPSNQKKIINALSEANIAYLLAKPCSVPEFVQEQLLSDGMPQWINTFFKFRIWSLSQFDKILFCDSDVFILNKRFGGFDAIFAMEPFSAMEDGCFSMKPTASGIPIAGIMLIQPSALIEKKLWDRLEARSSEGIKTGGDEPVIIDLFSPIDENHRIRLHYQANLGLLDKYPIKHFVSVHFPGKEKPWMKCKRRIFRELLSFVFHRRFYCAHVYFQYTWHLQKWIRLFRRCVA